MSKYAVIRTDNMSGTEHGYDLVSGKYVVSNAETAIENGCVVVVGALLTNEREVRSLSTPAANSAKKDIAIVASEEVDKTKKMNHLDEFINEAGAIVRCYRLETPNQLFSLTKEGFAAGSVFAVGNVVELTAGNKLKAVASLTSGSTKIGTIDAVEGDYYLVRVD